MSSISRRPLWASGRVLPINTDDPFISSERLATMPRPIDPYHLANIQPLPLSRRFQACDWQSVSPEHLERTGSSGLVREMRPKRTYDMVDIRPHTNMTLVYTPVDHAQPSASHYVNLHSHTLAYATANPPPQPKRRRRQDVLEEQYTAPAWDHHQYHQRKLDERIRLMPSAPSSGDNDHPLTWRDAHKPRQQPAHWSSHLDLSRADPSIWTRTPTECPSPTLAHTARFENTSSSSSNTIATPSSGQSDSPLEHVYGADFSSWFSGVQSSPRLAGFKPYRPSIGLMLSEREKEEMVMHFGKELGGLGIVIKAL